MHEVHPHHVENRKINLPILHIKKRLEPLFFLPIRPSYRGRLDLVIPLKFVVKHSLIIRIFIHEFTHLKMLRMINVNL